MFACSAHTPPQKTERKHFVHGRSVLLWHFFPLDTKQRVEIEEAWRQILLNSMRRVKINKNTHKKQNKDGKLWKREGGHYVDCYEWVACRERDGRQKRGRTIDRYREKHRQRTSIKALSVCCAQQPTHCKERRWNREGTGCLLKMGWRRGGKEKCEKDTPALKARREAMIRLWV